MPAPIDPDLSTYSGKLAYHLRELRQLRGMEVEELVSQINKHGYPVKERSYRNWENGTAAFKLDAFPFVAKALGVESVYEFFPKLEIEKIKK